MSETAVRQLSELRVTDLRNELEKRGLDKQGVKQVLLERLKQALTDEGENAEEYIFQVPPTPNTKKSTSASSSHENGNEQEHSQNDSLNTTEIEEEVLDFNEDCADLDSKSFEANSGSTQSEDANGAGNQILMSSLPEDVEMLDNAAPDTPTADEIDAEAMEENADDDAQDKTGFGVTSDAAPVPEPPNPESLSGNDTLTVEDTIKMKVDTENAKGTEENTSLIVQIGETDDLDYDIVSEVSNKSKDDKGRGSTSRGESDSRGRRRSGGTSGNSPQKRSNGTSDDKDKSKDDTKSRQDRRTEKTNSRYLWVSNLSSTTKAAELKQLFSAHGKVAAAKIVMNAKSPGSNCFGFIQMGSAADANNCVRKLNKTEIDGRTIYVDKRTNEPQTSQSKPATQSASATEKSASAPSDSKTKTEKVEKDDKKDVKKDAAGSVSSRSGVISLRKSTDAKPSVSASRDRDKERGSDRDKAKPKPNDARELIRQRRGSAGDASKKTDRDKKSEKSDSREHVKPLSKDPNDPRDLRNRLGPRVDRGPDYWKQQRRDADDKRRKELDSLRNQRVSVADERKKTDRERREIENIRLEREIREREALERERERRAVEERRRHEEQVRRRRAEEEEIRRRRALQEEEERRRRERERLEAQRLEQERREREVRERELRLQRERELLRERERQQQRLMEAARERQRRLEQERQELERRNRAAEKERQEKERREKEARERERERQERERRERDRRDRDRQINVPAPQAMRGFTGAAGFSDRSRAATGSKRPFDDGRGHAGDVDGKRFRDDRRGGGGGSGISSGFGGRGDGRREAGFGRDSDNSYRRSGGRNDDSRYGSSSGGAGSGWSSSVPAPVPPPNAWNVAQNVLGGAVNTAPPVPTGIAPPSATMFLGGGSSSAPGAVPRFDAYKSMPAANPAARRF